MSVVLKWIHPTLIRGSTHGPRWTSQMVLFVFYFFLKGSISEKMFYVIFMLSGERKSKQQWETTWHLLVWPKSRTPMVPCASEDMEQQDSLLVRVQSGTATLEDMLTVSCKIKHAFTIPPQNHTLWNFPKGAENLCLHKILHTDVYCTFIHHCQKLGSTKMSFSRWMDKQSVVHSDNGVFFCSKKKWVPKSWEKKKKKNMEEP